MASDSGDERTTMILLITIRLNNKHPRHFYMMNTLVCANPIRNLLHEQVVIRNWFIYWLCEKYNSIQTLVESIGFANMWQMRWNSFYELVQANKFCFW